MIELIRRIVQALVDSPEVVDVQEIDGTNMKLLEIRVSKQDVGRLIGKKARNITALRSIVSAAGNLRPVEYVKKGPTTKKRLDPMRRCKEEGFWAKMSHICALSFLSAP